MRARPVLAAKAPRAKGPVGRGGGDRYTDRVSDDPFQRFARQLRQVAAPLVPAAATLTALGAAGETRAVAKGAQLLRAGEVAGHVYFVAAGLFRTCSTDPATGDERTGQFFDEDRLFTESGSFFAGAPSAQAIEAVEPSVALCLPRAALMAAYDADHAVERFGRIMVEEALMGSQRRTAGLLSLSPDERYRRFVATRPEVARRVPQYLIASYLGITPEALSRIRGRLARRPPR